MFLEAETDFEKLCFQKSIWMAFNGQNKMFVIYNLYYILVKTYSEDISRFLLLFSIDRDTNIVIRIILNTWDDKMKWTWNEQCNQELYHNHQRIETISFEK